MIHDFAIEPELVATWGGLPEYRFFSGAFGLGHPRVMAEFPKLKNWRRQVLRAAQAAGDIEQARISALVNVLSERMASRAGEYDGTQAWLRNAEEEHARSRFHAILATGNPRHHPAVLLGAAVGAQPDDRWDLPTAATPRRVAGELASAVATMLRASSTVVFVDPHFGPENARHRRPLEALLAALCNGRLGGELPARIEVRTGARGDEQFFCDECRRKLPAIIPAGVSVRFVRLSQRQGGEKLHQRYILTDLGGVRVDPGLDDGAEGESFDLNLMDRAQYELRWEQYAGDTPAFDVVGEVVEIAGRAR